MALDPAVDLETEKLPAAPEIQQSDAWVACTGHRLERRSPSRDPRQRRDHGLHNVCRDVSIGVRRDGDPSHRPLLP